MERIWLYVNFQRNLIYKLHIWTVEKNIKYKIYSIFERDSRLLPFEFGVFFASKYGVAKRVKCTLHIWTVRVFTVHFGVLVAFFCLR